MKEKVLAAMSGGVDSSVAALILLEKGYDVVGATMQIWQSPETAGQKRGNEACCSLSAVEDARSVAFKIGIPFYVINLKNIFKEKVIDYFVNGYLSGKTPNPCIECNKHLKFDALLNKAAAIDARYVATGHYANVGMDSKGERYILKKSADRYKDQTYVLYNLTQNQLARTLFPLGDKKKTEVREIARVIGFSTADKPDSQDICFIDDGDYNRFILEEAGVDPAHPALKPGLFTDTAGRILGRHKGIAFYTVGQRRGLGISAGKRMFVLQIDPAINRIILGGEDEAFTDRIYVSGINYISAEELKQPIHLEVKTRYSTKEAWAVISPDQKDTAEILFDVPQKLAAPGQSAVFYDNDTVVGGGVIDKSGYSGKT